MTTQRIGFLHPGDMGISLAASAQNTGNEVYWASEGRSPDTLARAETKGIRAKGRLADNDGHGFFEALGDQIVTGPTLTNVNDFRAILIAGPEAAATAAE